LDDTLLLVLRGVIQRHVSPDVWAWLIEKAGQSKQFTIAFAATPRKTGKQRVSLTGAEEVAIGKLRPGFSVRGWTIDRLTRVWLIMNLPADVKDVYIRSIETLFPTAEMNELVALYSALPVLAYPESWKHRCAEGIRSNIADVLESIMCNNPYPAEHLDEPAWNQLILKAIFTDKPIEQVIGLDQRANVVLADTLSDYAHERWAAHREVNLQLWRFVGPFINASIFPDIQRIAQSSNREEREAAVLACLQSTYAPARALVENTDELRAIVQSGITWNAFAQRISLTV